jgi:hypothetical protein
MGERSAEKAKKVDGTKTERDKKEKREWLKRTR